MVGMIGNFVTNYVISASQVYMKDIKKIAPHKEIRISIPQWLIRHCFECEKLTCYGCVKEPTLRAKMLELEKKKLWLKNIISVVERILNRHLDFER